MAYDAAKNRVSGGDGDVGRVSRGREDLVSGRVGGRFIPRSAPGDEIAAQRLRDGGFQTPLPFLVIISPLSHLPRNRQLPVVI